MSEAETFDVIIVGAGGAGLTLAFHLKQLGIQTLILEKHNQVGSSWLNMPEHLNLITFWQSNALLENDLPLYDSYRAHSAKEFAQYLNDFANKHEINICFNHEVLSSEKNGNCFMVHTVEKSFKARAIVHCEGYFNNPRAPHFKIGENPPPIIHFNQFKNAKDISSFKNICVVGKRLSAGQVIEELVKSEQGQKIYLSRRSPIKFGAPPLIFKFFLKNLPFIELIMSIFVSSKKVIEVPMSYELKRIIENNVEIIEDITKVAHQKIFTVDNKEMNIDLIILATGYEDKKISFKNNFESATEANRYYLGVSNQRTFASRFLRGIRDDAPILAQLIWANLISKNKFQ
jgi:putative flavoprotein involved in K+ transport